MPTIEYRKSEPADRSQILAILAENNPNVPAHVREAVFDWQYGANPHDDGRSPFWLAVVDGEIGGVNGLMPVRIRYRSNSLLGVWSCDTLVSQRFRGLGLGKGLLRSVTQEAQVVMGYGISDMSDPILSKLGWQLGEDACGLFFYVSEPGAVGMIKNARSSLFRLAHWHLQEDGVEVALNDSRPFGQEIDRILSRTDGAQPNSVLRDSAYLNWRYRQHPILRYQAYEARNGGKLQAVLIARHSPIESVIVDYIGPFDHSTLKAGLVDAAINDLSQRGTRRIRCESTDTDMIRTLERAGFRKTKACFRHRVFSRFEGDTTPAANWLIMAGDSDNDFSAIGKVMGGLA